MSVPVIVGGGLAGLTAALALAPKPVVVLGRRREHGMTSSSLAQGGLAAAVGPDDSPALHIEDTLRAGAGLCDPVAVRSIVEAGPQAVERLIGWGVAFDRDETGALSRSLEGAHSRRRVVHAKGDSTGAVIAQTLIDRARATPSITYIEADVLKLETEATGAIAGVAFRREGQSQVEKIATAQAVLATGSASALWRHTTVPSLSWGHGLALAALASARLRDMEMVQFHPTALDNGSDPMPLISEAVRGEGGQLITMEEGRFTEELAPRDVVARAIWAEMEKGRRVYLDARRIEAFAQRFPTIMDYLREAGIDPSREPIPIRPVAHYFMGGIATDLKGRTNVPGLWACGECACTGLHGANRLASNSLLEATVMGARVAADLAPLAADRGDVVFEAAQDDYPPVEEDAAQIQALRDKMENLLGVRRSREGMEELATYLAPLAVSSLRARVGLMAVRAALARRESRGAHQRTDFPQTDPAQAHSLFVRWRDGSAVIENERTETE